MVGRYGTDGLNRFLSAAALVLIVLDILCRIRFLYVLALILIVVIYARSFSKNTAKRFAENQKYEHYRFYAEEFIKKLRFTAQEKRKYKIFKCPNCGQKLRIPRGHGKISIHCRACGHDFMGKS